MLPQQTSSRRPLIVTSMLKSRTTSTTVSSSASTVPLVESISNNLRASRTVLAEAFSARPALIRDARTSRPLTPS